MSKKCIKCNQVFEDESIKFCPTCGSNEFVFENTAPETQQSFQAEEPAKETVQITSFSQINNQPKVSGKGNFKNFLGRLNYKRVAFVAIPLILVLAIIFNFSFLYGHLIKIFGSDKSYMHFVEKKAFGDYAATVADYYEDYFFDNIDGDNSYDITITPIVSDDFSKIVKKLGGGKLDLDWINDAKINLNVNSYKDRLSEKLQLVIDGEEIISADMLFDLSENEVLVALGDLSDYVLRMDMESAGVDYAVVKEALKDALPKPSVVKKLIKKYAQIAIETVDDVSVGSETKTVDGVSQKLTVIEYTIDEETVINMAINVLTEAQDDKEIKKIIENAQEALEDADLYESDDDAYDMFLDGIDNLLDELDEELDDADDDELVTISDYVNGSHEIVGRTIEADGEEVSYIVVKDGKKTALEINIADEVVIKGSGTKKGGKVTADYDVKVRGDKVGTVSVKDFNVDSIKSGKISGKIRFEIDGDFIENSELKYLFPSEYRSFISMLDPAIEMTFDTTYKSGEYTVVLFNGNNEIIGAKVEYDRSSGKKIKDLDGDVIDVDDSDDMEDFVKELDLDSIVDKLEDANVPDDIIDVIEDGIKSYTRLIERAYGDYDYSDFYAYDEDDYYYY